MRLVISSFLLLIFSVNTSAQSLSNHLEIPPTSPKLTLSVGLSPHSSTLYFSIPHGAYQVKPTISSTKWIPLLSFNLETRSQFVNASYSLETTFPMNPSYDIYNYSGAVINKSTFSEWTHLAALKLNISRDFKLGFAYHNRSIAFKENSLGPTTNFDFQLQKQNNLLITAENLFIINHFLIKPSVSYSLYKWSGSENSFVDRDSPNTDYRIPIDRNTPYVGVGLMLGNDRIAKNIRVNLRYEDHNNFVIRTNRYLFGIQYKFNVL